MKIIIIWLSLLTALIFWIWFLPQLVDVWQFLHTPGVMECPYPNGAIVDANNKIHFNWIDLTWQEYSQPKNINDCN